MTSMAPSGRWSGEACAMRTSAEPLTNGASNSVRSPTWGCDGLRQPLGFGPAFGGQSGLASGRPHLFPFQFPFPFPFPLDFVDAGLLLSGRSPWVAIGFVASALAAAAGLLGEGSAAGGGFSA